MNRLSLLQPRMSNSPDEGVLDEEKSLTVRRFPLSDNGHSSGLRRRSSPTPGSLPELVSSGILSASVSSPGLLSRAAAAEQGERARETGEGLPGAQGYFYYILIEPLTRKAPLRLKSLYQGRHKI